MTHGISRFFVSTLFVLAAASVSAGNIYVDETFEGASAFIDRNYPVTGEASPPTATTIAVKGANLRAYDTDAANTLPKPIFANTGTMVSTRHFQGAKSLQLASGQSLSVAPFIVGDGYGEFRFFQFAISATPETCNLPAGTKVGHYKSNWSTTTKNTVQASMLLDFVVNSSKSIDVVCRNTTSSVVATFQGGTGRWMLFSIITNIRRVETDPQPVFYWEALDPLTSLYKGPVTGLEPASFPQILAGMHFFANSKTECAYVVPESIGPGWGNDNLDTPADLLNTADLGWELVAENGGTLFIDNLYWDCGRNTPDKQSQGFSQEQSSRMAEFYQLSNETGPSAAKDWDYLN